MNIEIERRFLVRADELPPGHRWVLPYKDSTIIQTYLTVPPGSPPGMTERLRLRMKSTEFTESWEYTHTVKVPVPEVHGSQEDERVVSPYDYHRLLARADRSCVPVHKLRRGFTWDPGPRDRDVMQKGWTFELDIYGVPFEGLVVLEVELPAINNHLELPSFIPIEREITGERAYSNFGLARLGRCP